MVSRGIVLNKMICYGTFSNGINQEAYPMSPTTPAVPQESDRKRWLALIVLCTGFLMIILDQTIVNVALPSIKRDLNFSTAGLAWVINAYLIAFGGLLLLVGRLGDLIGRRRIFLAGLTVFTLASLLCGVADSQALLIGARFVQGIGGAMTSAVILGMIVTMFPAPVERVRAIGIYAFVASAGGAVGLLAGGVLTQVLSWHWIFFVNLPIGIVTAVLSRRLLPDDRGLGLSEGADLLGALLLVSSLMIGVYAIVETSTYGWGSLHTLAFGGGAVALMAAFIVRQATAAQPLMALRVFRSRDVSGANVIQMLMVAGIFGVFFLGALYLHQVLGYDPIEVGLAFLPVALGIAGMSLGVTARLIERIGARLTLVPGLALVALGLFLFSGASDHARYLPDLLPALASLGIGAGLAFPAVMTLAMSTATPEDSGLVSGLVNTSQQVGGALGLSVLASLSSSHTSTLRAGGMSVAGSLTGGYHLAFEIGAIAVAAGLGLAIVLVRSPRAGRADLVVASEDADEQPAESAPLAQAA